MRHGIGRKWLSGLLLGALVGCSSSGHRRESQKVSTAEPPLGSAAAVTTEEPVVQAAPAAEDESVAVTVTGRGADGNDIQGIVRMKASEAAAMGIKPGRTPGASYVPADAETAVAEAPVEPEVHPVSHQVER